MSANGMLFAVAAPFLGAILIALAHSRPNLREAATLAVAVLTFVLVLSVVPQAAGGVRGAGWTVLPGLVLQFALEPLGALFAVIASGLWIVTSLYSIGYMRANDEPRQTGFYACFAVAIGSTLGVAFAANLFTLFVFYELLTLSTYPLVAHKADREAMAAGRTYLVLLLGTSIGLLLPAILWTATLAGTLEFRAGGVLPREASATTIGLLLALYVFGLGKAAVMPFHRWLPAAMVAPTPVSALLHAVAVVKAGVFAIVKVIVYVFGIERLNASGAGDWLIYVAGFTIIAASIVALRQQNLKRRLAYSTISQLSYVIFAAALLTPISAIGAAIHIAGHALGKITLFFAAGSVYTATHATEIRQLAGIGRRMPWTMGAFAVGALAMIGVPPTAGFFGKWFILTSALGSGQWIAVAVMFASTVLTAGYFLPIVYAAFFGENADAHEHGEAPWPIVVALVATAAASIVLFLFPGAALDLARQMVER